MNWKKIFHNLPEDEHFEMLMDMYTAKKNITSVVLFSIGGHKIKSISRKEYKILAIQAVFAAAAFYLVDLYFNFFEEVANRPVQIAVVLLINMIVTSIIHIKSKIFIRPKVKEKEIA